MSTTTKRPKTPNRGVADIIRSIIVHCDRVANHNAKHSNKPGGWTWLLWDAAEGYDDSKTLRRWLTDWNKRAKRRKGGLGAK